MPIGQVKWFDTKKGYGFIVSEEGKDVFVHYTVIEGDGFRFLHDGETVSYTLGEKSTKGLRASQVTRQAGGAHGSFVSS